MSDPAAGGEVGGYVASVVQVATAAAGGGAGAAIVWKLIGWLTQWSERKAARLDAQEVRADQEWRQIREDIKDQLKTALVRIEKMETQNTALRRAFNHVAGALIRIDPRHPALTQADQIMGTAFPFDFELSTARAESALDSIEDKPGAG